MDIKEVNEYIQNVLKEEKTNEVFLPLEDVCPVCSSEDIEFGSLNSELPDGVYYECICNNCGATFNQ